MTVDHTLEARELTLGYDQRTIVDGLNLVVPGGAVSVIIGANASGKSTLLRGLARLLAPSTGEVLLDGAPIARVPSRELARVIGMLPQSPVAPDGITVSDLVGRGRHPHQGWFRKWSTADEAAVADALTATRTADLASRQLSELSGGQRQRVWIAMALAQETDILLLDEPTTFLDINHQIELLDLLTELNAARGTTIVIVLHELNLAARYADHLIAMRQGHIVAQGTPAEVVTEQTIREVFDLPSEIIADPQTGSPLVVPRVRASAPETVPAQPSTGSA
ncbi:ABC transporter ATP-binding protein [Leucobacter japonicus]|uniref:ABC transporter ATP-binding protein n=1 Tax=Leucobacter japonicus TaxID=1461259 RepID=UPI0006A75E9B|nr:ABC transporter ATP-binding protein [Leucobacter japonicus]